MCYLEKWFPRGLHRRSVLFINQKWGLGFNISIGYPFPYLIVSIYLYLSLSFILQYFDSIISFGFILFYLSNFIIIRLEGLYLKDFSWVRKDFRYLGIVIDYSFSDWPLLHNGILLRHSSLRFEWFQLMRDFGFISKWVLNKREKLLIAKFTSIAKWPNRMFCSWVLTMEYVLLFHGSCAKAILNRN